MDEKQLWNKFSNEYNIKHNNYEAWAFGGNPDYLLELVLKGIKTATASLYLIYELENLRIPQIGDYSVILDSSGEAHCIIKTTHLYTIPFKDVTSEHAFKEGERDRSLKDWKVVHEDFFKECLKHTDIKFNEDMLILCEEFEVVYKL